MDTLKRLDENRLTKKIFSYISKLKHATGRLEETKKDAEKNGITNDIINNGEKFRKLVDNTRFTEDQPKQRAKRVWTEEQRRTVGEKMRKFWEERRKRNQ